MPVDTTGTSPAAPVLICTPRLDLAAGLGLPRASSSLFQRMIRNPHAESDWAKERECAEMLCALLQNAPTVRTVILSWMASEAGLVPSPWEELSLTFETEQSVGPKRDDLRITGWDAEARQRLVWTIEIKVAASFHRSSPLRLCGESVESEGVPDVSQITNYDDWLDQQPADQRAGFVIALHDYTASMPGNLHCRWKCLTWTGIGGAVARALIGAELPPVEQFLARHVLGFIHDHLWRASEMSESRIDFNDIALIRAFAQLGEQCRAKVDRLVEPLVKVLHEYCMGPQKPKLSRTLFGSYPQTIAYWELATDAALCAGIGGDEERGDFLSLWLHVPPKHDQKSDFKASLLKAESELKARDCRWSLTSQLKGADRDEWVDLELTVPLAGLLVVDDQPKEVEAFVRRALNDLKETGVLDAFQQTIGAS